MIRFGRKNGMATARIFYCRFCPQRLGREKKRKGEDRFNVALRPHAEAVETIRDGEPRTATSTFTQLVSSGT